MPNPQSYADSLYRLMARRDAQQSPRTDIAYVTDRRVTGGTGASYAATVRGRAATGITTVGSDFEPGQTVLVQRGGRGGGYSQILGMAPPETRATQAPQTFDRDVTDEVLL